MVEDTDPDDANAEDATGRDNTRGRLGGPAATVPETAASEATLHLPDPAPEPTRVDPKLLELLVCPLTKDRLTYDAPAQELISPRARLAYPIRDGIPIMLPDEARAID